MVRPRRFGLAVLVGLGVSPAWGQTLGQIQQFAQVPNLPSPPPPQQLLRELTPEDRPRLSPGLQGAPITPQRVVPGIEGVPVVEAAIIGNESIPAGRFSDMVNLLVGQTSSADRLEHARIAILTEYRNSGYPFISVIASSQPVPGGSRAVFTVQEGRIARVRLDGNIGPAGTQVLRFLNGAVTSGPATTARIERALLLAGDVPGVTVRGVLQPLEGGAAGELELVAEVTRQAFSGLITADNRAYRHAGPVQFLMIGQANSFTSFGERSGLPPEKWSSLRYGLWPRWRTADAKEEAQC